MSRNRKAIAVDTTQETAHTTLDVVPEIARHRRCPVCYDRLRGKGNQYSSYNKGAITRCYLRCCECGHTWTADIKTEIVSIDFKHTENISSR